MLFIILSAHQLHGVILCVAISSTVTQSMAVSMTPTPTPTCKYFTSRFNSTHGPDDCAIGVFAAGGALAVIACTLMCIAILCCCRKRRRGRRKSKPFTARVRPIKWILTLTRLIYTGIAHDRETSENIR